MKIKGTSVKPTIDFVKENFPERYFDWFEKLPPGSQKIIKEKINPSKWYPINESTIIPTRIIGEMFYNDIRKAAHVIGRYCAEKGLKGIYRIFVRIATPKFIISRGGNIFASYFNPSKIEVDRPAGNIAYIYIYKFSFDEELMVYRIAGWIQRAFEITNCKNVVTNIEKKERNAAEVFKVTASWDK